MTKEEFTGKVEQFTGRPVAHVHTSPACQGLSLTGKRNTIPEMYSCDVGEHHYYGYANGLCLYHHRRLGNPFIPTVF